MYTNTYICEDCCFSFQVYAPKKKGKNPYFCPSCGDNVSVRKYTPDNTTKERVYLKWQDEEVALLEKAKTKQLAPYQVAIMTGRSIHSVKKKLGRI